MVNNEDERIFNKNIKLVYYVISKCYPSYIKDEDITQYGFIGLWKAAKNYNEKTGNKFSTYATYCIKNEILYYIKRLNKWNKLQAISIDELAENSNGDKTTLLDRVGANDTYSEINWKKVMQGLTPQRRKVLEYIAKGYTIQEISIKENVSRQNVSQMIIGVRKAIEIEKGSKIK